MSFNGVIGMTTSTVVPLQVYLETSYRPDCDCIDGEVRERNAGEGQHASVQRFSSGTLAIARKH